MRGIAANMQNDSGQLDHQAELITSGLQQPPLRVLSYNIHKGFSQGNRRFVLESIKRVLIDSQADILMLQEVLGEHQEFARSIPDWPPLSQFDYLAHEAWPHIAYGRNAVYNAGHHGNAILSRHHIVSFENIDVSSNPFESRGLLHAVIEPKNWPGRIHLLCVHLALVEQGRQKQVQQVFERVAEHVPAGEPLIIAGDFNDWRHKAGLKLEKMLGVREVHKTLHGRYARTFPSLFPLLHLDRIYVRGFEPLSAWRLAGSPWNGLSDHTPVFCSLSLNEARTG